jgi:hypothetical protein
MRLFGRATAGTLANLDLSVGTPKRFSEGPLSNLSSKKDIEVNIEAVVRTLGEGSFTTDEIYRACVEAWGEIEHPLFRSWVRQGIYSLRRRKILLRVGHGVYTPRISSLNVLSLKG